MERTTGAAQIKPRPWIRRCPARLMALTATLGLCAAGCSVSAGKNRPKPAESVDWAKYLPPKKKETLYEACKGSGYDQRSKIYLRSTHDQRTGFDQRCHELSIFADDADSEDKLEHVLDCFRRGWDVPGCIDAIQVARLIAEFWPNETEEPDAIKAIRRRFEEATRSPITNDEDDVQYARRKQKLESELASFNRVMSGEATPKEVWAFLESKHITGWKPAWKRSPKEFKEDAFPPNGICQRAWDTSAFGFSG